MGEKKGRSQRKLTNSLIDASFQTKIVVLVTGFVVLQGLVVSGYFIFAFNEFYQRLLETTDFNPAVADAVEILKVEMFMGLGAATIGFIVAAIILSFYFSHKLAGPNYAIKRAINDLLDGVDHKKINLRKGDEFHDLAQRINILFGDYHLVKKEDVDSE